MKILTLRNSLLVAAAMSAFVSQALDHPGITSPELSAGRFTLVEASAPVSVCVDPSDNSAVQIAAKNLCKDFGLVTGNDAAMVSVPEGRRLVIAGTVGTPLVDRLIKDGKISGSELKGKNEKYVMTVVAAPFAGVEEALVIAGSDRRGTVYGIYELSEQIGVSPWYDWADVPVSHHDNLSMEKGTYTAGEPAVKYRGIFLNDEAPCLTGWVKNTYGTGYGDHRFYERVFELILRLRGNFMCYTFGRFVDEKYKPAYYDSCVSFLHPVTGLFPHANPGELFVYMGIAAGVTTLGLSLGDLAIRYFAVGLIVIFIRGLLTEKIYLNMCKKAGR